MKFSLQATSYSGCYYLPTLEIVFLKETLYQTITLLFIYFLAISSIKATCVETAPLLSVSCSNFSTSINIVDAAEAATIDTSTIVVINETTCDMTIFCYEIDETGDLLNMGILAAGQSITIQPIAELGRLYAEALLTNEETASLYFYGGAFELRITSGCDTIAASTENPTGNNADDSTTDTTSYDCPILGANIGDVCSDGYPSTMDDRVTVDCMCEGTRASTTLDNCDSIKITTTNEYIIVSGLNTAEINSIQVFTMKWKPIFTCAGNCRTIEYVSLPNASYRVRVAYYNKAWRQVCDELEVITVQRSLTNDSAISRQQIVPTTLITKSFSTPTMHVFPNPTSQQLTVSMEQYADLQGQLQLVNLQGQIIHSINLSEVENSTWQLDVSGIARGLYVLQVTGNTSFKAEKVLIE